MKLSTPRYTFCLIFQLAFLFCDLIFNCISLFPRKRDNLIVLFIFQDLFLVLSIGIMLTTLFSTYLIQAGAGRGGVRGAWGVVAASGAYGAASVALHASWALAGAAHPSTPLRVLLFTLHRSLSPVYYWAARRAGLAAADPRLPRLPRLPWLSASAPATH